MFLKPRFHNFQTIAMFGDDQISNVHCAASIANGAIQVKTASRNIYLRLLSTIVGEYHSKTKKIGLYFHFQIGFVMIFAECCRESATKKLIRINIFRENKQYTIQTWYELLLISDDKNHR